MLFPVTDATIIVRTHGEVVPRRYASVTMPTTARGVADIDGHEGSRQPVRGVP